jgi:hypothetical protein
MVLFWEASSMGGILVVYQDVGWIHLAQDRDQCWAVVYTVMNLRVP